MPVSKAIGSPFIDKNVRALIGAILLMILIDYSSAIEPTPHIN